jgi:hypothetical protein
MTQNPQTCQVNYVRFGGPAAGWWCGFMGRDLAAPDLNISGEDHFFTCASEKLELYVLVY